MIVDADLSGLEWRVGAELSRDPVMIAEIVAGEDIHMNNSRTIFNDEEHRQISKTISFRSLYGGTAAGFFYDRNMPSFSMKRWIEIMEAFCAKYSRLIKWQNENYALVRNQGWLQTFTGRIYVFEKSSQFDGSLDYSRPAVCNYPVQGTATADIVPLVMCQIKNRLQKEKMYDIKIINQVHDSIVFDTPKKDVDKLAKICYYYFRTIPESVFKYWGYEWITPMDGEVKVGNDWSNMQKVKFL
jgi:DNA polymerase-1